MATGQPPSDGIDRAPLEPGERYRRCLECAYWYGAEDDEYGPCSLKTARDTGKFLTFGTFPCDEGFTEDEAVPVGEGG
ncbi:MAG: hypothetical protein R3185_02245 [Candidatus Thermoplasmatota archaeon]|nr:hypothetical protein [Candidatus Thermoplasmatota archaeon]